MKKAIFVIFLLATTFLLLSSPSVSAPDVLDTPIGRTITATSNETFVLSFKMKFNETDDGFFVVTFTWDNNETAAKARYLNFTYESFVAKFTDGTEFSVPINVTITKEVPYGYPAGYYRYAVQIYEAYGEPYGNATHPKDFWVNATVRAAGIMNGVYVPHIGEDQIITISKVRCYETETVEIGPGNCTIHVAPKIFSCNQAGNSKEVFDVALGEAVYVKGYGFSGGGGVRLYVLQNATWTEGRTWAVGDDVRNTFNSTSADANGNLTAYCLGLLPIGEYDIVADVYPYGKYGNATDAVDDLSSAPGITVVPEFPNGTFLIMTAILAVASLLMYIKKRKLPSFI